jgi:hypothetical protein
VLLKLTSSKAEPSRTKEKASSMGFANPLPKGEDSAKRRVRGEEKSLCTPHPALRATLSLRERDLP